MNRKAKKRIAWIMLILSIKGWALSVWAVEATSTDSNLVFHILLGATWLQLLYAAIDGIWIVDEN